MPILVPFYPSVYQFLVCEVKKEEKPAEAFDICLKLWEENKNPVIGEDLIKLAYKTGNKKVLKELAEFYKDKNPVLYDLSSFYLALLEKNEDAAYSFGKKLIRKGKFCKELLTYLFEKSLEKKDLETLLLILEHLHKQNPDNPTVKRMLKSLYLLTLQRYKDNPQKVEEILKRALKNLPDDKNLLELAIDYYIAEGKLEEARKLAKKLKWDNLTFDLERLKVLFSLGKKEELEKLLDELVEKYPRNVKVLKYALNYYALKGDSEKLSKIMENYLKLNPKPETIDPAIVLKYFLPKIWNGNLTPTEKGFLEKYIETYGNNPKDEKRYITANLLRAAELVREGKYEEGLEVLKKLKPLAGDNLNKFILYPAYKAGDIKTYGETLKKENREEVYLIAEFFKERDKEFVENLLKDYARLNNTPESYEFSIWALDRLGFWNDAEELLKEAIKKFPDNAEFYNYLGYSYLLYFGKEKLDKALKLLKKAHELAPDDAPILDSLGWAYFIKGDLEKAKHYLEEALKRMPDDPVINEHYAVLLLTLAKRKGIDPCKDKNDPLVKRAEEHLLKAYKLAKEKETEPEKGFFKRLKKELKEICVNPG